jgi:hypothetical protein
VGGDNVLFVAEADHFAAEGIARDWPAWDLPLGLLSA